MKWFVLFVVIVFSGCVHLPKIRVSWPDSELAKEVSQLKIEKDQLAADFDTKIAVAKEEEAKTQEARFGKGAADVHAANSSLKADPDQTRFSSAATQLLDNAIEALPTPSVEELRRAMEIKDNLISKQAELIKAGQTELQKQKEEILAAKSKESELRAQQEKLAAAAKEEETRLAKEIEAKQSLLEQERLEWAGKAEQDAAKWRKENSFWNRLNPFRHIAGFFSSIFVWVVIIIVVGGGLKVASIMFPGVNIIQSIVTGGGKVIGGIFGALFKWIPAGLEGAGAVDKKQHEIVAIAADNSFGSIQNFRDDHPDEYVKLKKKLEDWNKDAPPEVGKYIEERLKQLNQV